MPPRHFPDRRAWWVPRPCVHAAHVPTWQAAKFKVLVKNLPDEVEVQTLYHQFLQYGEVRIARTARI